MFEPSAEELRTRVNRLQAYLRESDVDGALIFNLVNLYYFSGIIGPGSMFIPAQGEPVFLSRQRGALPADLLWQSTQYRKWSELEGKLGDFGHSLKGRLGLEMAVLPVEVYLRLLELLPGTAFVDVGNQIRLQRAVKSAWEMEVLRETARKDQRIWQKVPEFIGRSKTDLELAALLEAEARREGHIGILRKHGFAMEMAVSCISNGEEGAILGYYDAPITGKGLTRAFPMGASGSRLEAGKPILIDFCSCFYGYTTDVTRMFSIGKPQKQVIEAFKIALSIQGDLLEWAKPGSCCGDLYDRAKAIADRAGFKHNFMGAAGGVPFVGHGIGMEIDELPVLAKGSRQVLEEGMTLAIEPKFALQGIGAVGIENNFLVTKQGLEKLSLVSDELVVC